MLLIGAGGQLPAIFLPAPAGRLLDRLNDCRGASGSGLGGSDSGSDSGGDGCAGHIGYAAFFLAGAACYALACLVLTQVRPLPPDKEKRTGPGWGPIAPLAVEGVTVSRQIQGSGEAVRRCGGATTPSGGPSQGEAMAG